MSRAQSVRYRRGNRRSAASTPACTRWATATRAGASLSNVEVALPQTYEAEPGTALARFMVTRVRKTDGSWK